MCWIPKSNKDVKKRCCGVSFSKKKNCTNGAAKRQQGPIVTGISVVFIDVLLKGIMPFSLLLLFGQQAMIYSSHDSPSASVLSMGMGSSNFDP
jgi:hypothetical protein